MSLNVSDAFNQIEQELNLISQQVDQSDVFLYLTRAVNYLSTAYALPTSKKYFDTIFFNGVRQIGLPTDFGTIIEPQRPPALHSPRFMMESSRELAHWPYGRKLAIEFVGSTPYLDVADDQDSSLTLLAGCNDTTGVTLSGDGSSLLQDQVIYTEGTGSLRFTVTAVTGQTVLTFVISLFDITTALTQNWIFLDLIAPSTNTANLTNIKLRIGTDASNYYEMTATTRYRGDAIGSGYGQVGFDLSTRTTTGTPTNTNITYLQVILNTGTTGVNGVYRLDNIFTAQGVYFQVPYYSKFNILSGGVTPTDQITALTDVIMLPQQCNEAIVYKTMELICSSPNVKDQSFAQYAARELKPKEDLLNSLYPLERINVQSTWYKKTNFKRRDYGYSSSSYPNC